MANNRPFKIKNGLIAGRYLQSAGTKTAGSEGYSLANASYDSVSLSVSAQEATPSGLFFKPDGTKMYVIGYGSDNINEYSLSTAWDVSTATYSAFFSVAAQDTAPYDLFFKTDGTKMYVVGGIGDDINEYDLSTAWDVTTASYLQNFSVSAQDGAPVGLFFKPDGTKVFVVGISGQDVNEYDLSTAWDISTASYLQNFSIAAQETTPSGLFFKPDGTKMYVDGTSGDDVNEYSLSTPWDISTASYLQNFSVRAQVNNPTGLFFKSDGTKMYVVGVVDAAVYQYSTILYTQTLDLSTGTYFSFTPSVNTEILFTNPPASGEVLGFTVEINGDGSTITWPNSIKWNEAITPTATPSKEIYTFITTDGGTTYYGRKAAENLQ